VEYALMLLFIAVVAVSVIAFLGPGISNAISNIANSLWSRDLTDEGFRPAVYEPEISRKSKGGELMMQYLLPLFTVDLRSVLARMRREEGQGLAEYALILAFIAVVAVVALVFLGPKISNLLSSIANDL
jgi:pilus assembly protein Flp/PilA